MPSLFLLAARMLALKHAFTFPARVCKSFFGKPDQSNTEKMLASEVPELNSPARSLCGKAHTDKPSGRLRTFSQRFSPYISLLGQP